MQSIKNIKITAKITGSACLALVCLLNAPHAAQAQIDMSQKPVLVITNEAMPANDLLPVYSRPSRAPEITPEQVSGPSYFEPTETVVGRKVDTLRTDLFALQSRIGGLSDRLRGIENTTRMQSAAYNASVATINTQLQAGTTPGNPRLVGRLSTAQIKLDEFSQNVAELNALAVDVTGLASNASFLLEAARAMYSLSGAIEEDHARLSQLEDQINGVIVMVERLLNSVNDDITRTTTFLNAEHKNLRTIALGVTTGDMYGGSIANKTFGGGGGMVQPVSYGGPMAPAPMSAVPAAMSAGRRPLAKIRFDRPDVSFEQPVYQAVSQAMERYPQARFEIIAVHPTTGNAAQMAIESTRARRNAEKVLRSLSQMGLSMNNVQLTASQSPEARTNEVHIFIQ